VWRSLDGGATYTVDHAGIDSTDPRAFVAPLALDRGDPKYLFYGTDRVWENSNAATTGPPASWRAISPHLPCAHGFGPCYLIALGVSDATPATVYAATTGGDLYVTTDGGAHWTHRLPASGSAYGEIAVDPTDPSRAYVAEGTAFNPASWIAVTSDAGRTWHTVARMIDGDPVYSVAADWSASVPTLFAGTEFGLYWSIDGGRSWHYAAGFPHTDVRDLYLEPTTRKLYAATYGRSVLVASLGPVESTTSVTASTTTTSVTSTTTAVTSTTTTTTTQTPNPAIGAASLGKGAYSVTGTGWNVCTPAQPVSISVNGKQFTTASPDGSGGFQLTTSAVASGDTLTAVQKTCDGSGTLQAKASVP
jgi:hypothetical protein